MDQAKLPQVLVWNVDGETANLRLDSFARRCLPHLSRRQLEQAIHAAAFAVNGKAGKKGTRLMAGDHVAFVGPNYWLRDRPLAAPFNMAIVYEDDALLAVDKPAGVATHGFSGRDEATLANGLVALRPELLGVGKSPWEPGLVHRLDIETSGILLVAKTQDAFDKLRGQFRRREVNKIYWTLVEGWPGEKGMVDFSLAHDPADDRRMIVVEKGARQRLARSWAAATGYRCVARSGPYSLLEIEMATGVTHQIRVHMASLGCPIVGDGLYGSGADAKLEITRQFLHARSLAFHHPTDGRRIELIVDLPEDLQACLQCLEIQL